MSLNVKHLGTGPDLVLLHGWALSMEVWEPIANSLAQHFRLTLVDLPGHGGSSLHEEFTVDSIIKSLRSVIPQGAIVLGWSLGGMFGLTLAARHPRLIHKLVLLASNPCFVATPGHPFGMTPNVLEQFGKDLVTNYRDTVARFLAASTLGAKKGPALLRKLMLNMSAAPQPDIEALQGGLKILQDTDLWPQLENVFCPTLILLGEQDMLVPVAVGSEMSRALSSSQLEIIASAGHAPFLSHPKLFVEIVRDFAA